VTTVANAGAEPSVQLAASATLPQVYAHSNRLGGVSYLTDTDGKLVSYNVTLGAGKAVRQREQTGFCKQK
jgi:hypothetical protein